MLLASGALLGPLIPQLVEATYDKLLTYDATARHFVPAQSGFQGPAPEGLAAVSANHPQVKFRKEHLTRYFMQILGRTCDARLAPYLDMVGKIHTPQAGSTEIDVPLVQMNALLGYLADVVIQQIETSAWDTAMKFRTIRAFSKFLWIQNDFISRHYSQQRANSLSAGE